VLIVATAQQPDAIFIVQMRERESVDVFEFEVARRRAPESSLVYKRASPAVALVDLPLDRVRDVAGGRLLLHDYGGRLARFPTDPEPLLLHVVDQQVERPLDDAGQVSIRNAVPEQVLSHSQLVVKFLVRGELHPVRLLCKRFDGAPMVFRLGALAGAGSRARASGSAGAGAGRSGSFRIVGATAGCGARRATNSSISRFVLPAASASTSQ